MSQLEELSSYLDTGVAALRASKVWIDLDNSPHVPFFAPIMKELEREGIAITLTARDCFQVCGLADLMRLKYRKIGRHYGKNMLMKLAGLGLRAMQLIPTALKERPTLAISHGSRSQLIACRLLRIPTVIIGDYEHSTIFAFVRPRWLIVPEVIPAEDLEHFRTRLLRYPGIKEDVYVSRFRPDADFRKRLGISEDTILVTVRPPATEAHYHVPESDELFTSVLNLLERNPEVSVIFLPRNQRQGDMLRSQRPELFAYGQAQIPDDVLDGLNLVWHSDLVISGGGTMNREAAALGVPVYSIFSGRIGAVDNYLSAQGRLTLVRNTEEVWSKIRLEWRPKLSRPDVVGPRALQCIIAHILNLLSEL